jgi:tRNA 2-thiouridine synthesizing protein E
MVCVNVKMKYSGLPLKRTPVELLLDDSGQRIGPAATDRSGRVCFEMLSGSGKVIVAGVERYQGHLDGLIDIELRNLTEMGNSSEGAAYDQMSGNTAYPNMTTRAIVVDGREVLTDSEGYLVNPGEWSEEFVRQQADIEALELTREHWDVIRFQRNWFARHGRQASVRDMIKHFRKQWDNARGSSRYLHKLFPRGGPQKQGNRLAGLLRTKGEH